MPLSVCVFVLLFVPCFVFTDQSDLQNSRKLQVKEIKRNGDFIVDLDTRRTKRMAKFISSAVAIGLKAVKTLLKGTTEIPSETRRLREFLKPGNYQQALKDFDSVDPTNVRRAYGPGGVLKVGEVGDRTVILTRGRHVKKKGRNVTIEIINSKYMGSGIDRITYFDKN